MKVGFRQWMLSMTVFVVIMGGLTFVDERVRDRFTALVAGGDGMSPMNDRLADLGGALWSAARYQSIENAPLVVFAALGMVLFLFMART